VIQQPDSRSALSIGLDWGTRVTTIGIEFALPAVLGFGLDRWWNTIPWLTLAGAVLGLAMGMTHVFRLAFQLQEAPGSRPPGIDRGEAEDPPAGTGSL
jgi:ATP synthase protein I